MAKLDAEPDVVSMALGLKLDPRRGAVAEILRHCRDKIDGWVAEAGGAGSLAQVEQIVCGKLSLRFEEVRTDDELRAASRRYVQEGDVVFAHVPASLDEGTFATTYAREHSKRGEARYIAFIDCRTRDKAARRFFTRWHEIAHLLTLTKQLHLPFHRSTGDESPLERLMDAIAGEVAFHAPLFQPVLEQELGQSEGLTFAGVERVRAEVCPEASYQATLIACVKRSPLPCVHLEVGLGYKKAEERRLKSRQLSMFEVPKPEPKLRVLRSAQNDAARAIGLMIHQNMQVPDVSVIAAHFQDTAGLEASDAATGVESLSVWVHSNGEALGESDIRIEVRRYAELVHALVQPC